MEKRNILMCLEYLDIGGVETAVLTLCKGYIRAGHKVYVAAKRGIFAEDLEKIGVEILNLEHKIKNYFCLDKKEQLIDFCKEKKITEIHIHQYPCIMYWLPVCMELKIPYVAYAHSIVPGAIDWFTKEFSIYHFALPAFFENASKIVCIAESTKDEIEERYHLGDEKYIIVPNSLNMEDFVQTKTVEKLATFGIAARFSEEKIDSIKRGINLFIDYSKDKKNCKLLIAGDGIEKNKLVKYVESKKIEDNIDFLGSVSNMPKFYEKIDAFIGVDRCILEAMACKRLAIISSYTGSMNIVNKNNIEIASSQNFSGMNLEDNKDILKDLNKIDKKQCKTITEDNYKFINKKYNVDNNLYNYELTTNYTCDYKYAFEITYQYSKQLYKINSNWLVRTYRSIIIFVRRILQKIKNLFMK